MSQDQELPPLFDNISDDASAVRVAHDLLPATLTEPPRMIELFSPSPQAQYAKTPSRRVTTHGWLAHSASHTLIFPISQSPKVIVESFLGQQTHGPLSKDMMPSTNVASLYQVDQSYSSPQ